MAKIDELWRMQDLTEGFKTKADKMRVLAQHGYKTADIARFLEVRYQQVRNTLEGDKRTGYAPELVPAHPTDEHPDSIAVSNSLRVIPVGDDGFAQVAPDLIEDLTENDEQLLAIPIADGIFLTNLAGLTARTRRSLSL